MRARAGDRPRTMPQKILAGRADDPTLDSDFIEVRVDQVVLSKEPSTALQAAFDLGLKKCAVETAVVYDGRCLSSRDIPESNTKRDALRLQAVQTGILLARPGIGFPAAVHLERFAAPARLALTDDPRLASLGGAGQLTLVASPTQIADVLARGKTRLRTPSSVQILLSGKLLPFVAARDVALQLLRLGLSDVVQRIDQARGSPVILEFCGPSVRLLSLAERALLCSLAPQVGAAGALCLSDEKTEVHLRDQRRSKGYRALGPDPGAPSEEVISLDLGSVDPLLRDEQGVVRAVRELEGRKITQVVLGGDTGASIKDLLAAAALLKSKRVSQQLELLLVPPSRQVLEVLAASGALSDLLATGARLTEPDPQILSGSLYPPASPLESLRSFDPFARDPGASPLVASAETLVSAVTQGEVADPRVLRRAPKVSVPRALPTEDVFIVRKAKGRKFTAKEPAALSPSPEVLRGWVGPSELKVATHGDLPKSPTALVCSSLEQVRWAADRAGEFTPHLRAIAAPYLPAAYVPLLSGLGILALTADLEVIRRLLDASELHIPELSPADEVLSVRADGTSVDLRWLAVGDERDWTLRGSACAEP